MKSSANVLAEIESKIGLSWYQEMCETTKPVYFSGRITTFPKMQPEIPAVIDESYADYT